MSTSPVKHPDHTLLSCHSSWGLRRLEPIDQVLGKICHLIHLSQVRLALTVVPTYVRAIIAALTKHTSSPYLLRVFVNVCVRSQDTSIRSPVHLYLNRSRQPASKSFHLRIAVFLLLAFGQAEKKGGFGRREGTEIAMQIFSFSPLLQGVCAQGLAKKRKEERIKLRGRLFFSFFGTCRLVGFGFWLACANSRLKAI